MKKSKKIKILAILLGAAVWLTAWQAYSQTDKKPTPAAAAKMTEAEIIVDGKLFYSLKRQVLAPFRGIVTKLEVEIGQAVKKGQSLAMYQLGPEESFNIKRSVSQFGVRDLEMRMAQVKNNLAQLESKRNELRQLTQNNLAPKTSLTQVERNIRSLTEQKNILWKQMKMERILAKQNQELLTTRLGRPINSGKVPEEAALVSPIDGHVVWIDPNIRPGAEIAPGMLALQVAVMQPMLLRAQVYEIEAASLKTGDIAVFSLESVPGRKFEAVVSRLSWVPISPQLQPPTYYIIEFTVQNPDFALKEGYKGRIFLH